MDGWMDGWMDGRMDGVGKMLTKPEQAVQRKNAEEKENLREKG